MRRSFLVLVVLAGLGGSTAGCGDDKTETYDVTLQPTSVPASAVAPLTIEQSAAGSTVEATVGQRVLVRLSQDPASTDQWAMVNDDEGILIADGGPTSEGNATVWPFRATERGTTSLEFVYGPSSEPAVGPEPTFLVNVRVN
ncbi:protease inhibitor I42 family protein [Nocardia sp. NPDC058519]|uniref:protease inhibitor I42 family protein n=1 Tax=Nocardia sp. NPDC058519 TaxID=3346535 RepID=UPI003667BF0F